MVLLTRDATAFHVAVELEQLAVFLSLASRNFVFGIKILQAGIHQDPGGVFLVGFFGAARSVFLF